MKRKSLNVCHVFATFLPVTSGGVEHHIISISKYMSSFGHTCLLITPRYSICERSKSFILPKTETFENLRVFRVGLLFLPYTNKRFIGPFLKHSLNKFDSLLGAYTWLRRRVDFDIVHAHSGDFSLDLGLRLSKWSEKPLIVSVHQKFGYESGDIVPDYRKYKEVFKATDKIIVHRNSTRLVLERWGLGHKTVFIPMFIDVRKHRKPKTFQFSRGSGVRILFIGRLVKRRDPLTLLRAFIDVCRYYPDTELHIVGDGSLRKHVMSIIRRYRLERNVFLHGKQLDIKKYLWQSDIYVSTNTVDDYPSLALREAMSAGLAIIATDVGETRKLIRNGKNALLIPPSDPIALSKAILTLIEDEKLKKKLIANAQLSSQDFDISKGIQPLIKIYREVSGR